MDLTNKEIEHGGHETAKVSPVRKRLLKFLRWLEKGQKGAALCKS
jgi:hypothetical protein